MKLMKLMIFTLALAPVVVSASSNIVTDVEWVGQRGNGNVIIKFKDIVDEASCANKEIEIEASNPHAKGLLSIAMAAYASNITVNVKTDGCSSVGGPTITSNGYIIFQPKP